MSAELISAEARVAAARARLSDTVGDLQAKLDPRSMAREAVEGMADGGQRAIGVAVDTVQRHPGKIAGAAAAVMLFTARHRIMALFGKTGGKTGGKPKPARKTDVSSHQTRRHRRPEER